MFHECFVEQGTWDSSERFCKAQGMELVSIESEEEQDELNKILVDSGNSLEGGPLNEWI